MWGKIDENGGYNMFDLGWHLTANVIETVDRNGLLQGERLEYVYNTHNNVSDGVYLHNRKNYVDGKLEGDSILYYPSGGIMMKRGYKDGKLDGWTTMYYEDGVISIRQQWKNGKRHGERIEYDSGGRLAYATFYYEDRDLCVDATELSGEDKMYIMMCGRVPSR